MLLWSDTGKSSLLSGLGHEQLKPLNRAVLLHFCACASKLPFRRLVAQYNTHITTTPMILSREFSRNQTARDADFTTSQHERAVYEVVQPRSEDGDALEAPILKNWKPHLSKNQEEEDNSSGKPKPRLVRGCLIAQFAANDPIHLAEASELIRPYVDAIDINCGCPQKWAYAEGIGSFLCVLLLRFDQRSH